MLLEGKIPIYEPGLDRLVADNMAAGRLTFPATLEEGIADAEAVFIAVGTPARRGDGHADLTYVFAAVEQVVQGARPSGRHRDQIDRAGRHRAENRRAWRGACARIWKIDVASNPEFLREGSAITDFMRPDRVVVGADSDRRARCCAGSTGRFI